MRYQSTKSSCGAAAVANALHLLQYPAPLEEEAIRLAGTRWDGTSMAGVARAIKKSGYVAHEIRSKAFPHGIDVPMILLVDNGDHWVTVQKLPSGRWLVVDGAHNDMVFTQTLAELTDRARRDGARKPFTAVAIMMREA